MDGKPLCTMLFRNNVEYTVSDGRNKEGKPLSFGDLRNGIGTLRFFDPFSGKLLSCVAYKNGKHDGEFLLYYHTGELFKKGTFKNDAVEGEFTEYFKNGNVREKGTFWNATQTGDHIAYFRSGRTRITESWVNGKEVKAQEFDHAGRMLRDGRIVNGSYSETHFNYNGGGELESKGEFREGLKNGPYEYMKHGNLIRREIWKNDTLLREMIWYTSGEKEALIVYKNDQRDSIYTEYYINGSLRIQQGYKEGVKHGIYCSYYDNGQLYIKGKYVDGEPDGKFDCYTKEGKYKGNYIPKKTKA
jgi:antitoxin component YwqK of YwqJK toxin-antitoxin module